MDRNTSIWDYYRINQTTRREPDPVPDPDPDPDTDSAFDPNAEAAIPAFEELFASPGIPENENNPAESFCETNGRPGGR